MTTFSNGVNVAFSSIPFSLTTKRVEYLILSEYVVGFMIESAILKT